MKTVDFVARCMIGHNTKDIKSLISDVEQIKEDIGGVKIVQITKEDYDALTDKPTNIIYFVSDGDKITLYIGGGRVGTSTSGLMKMKSLNAQYSRQGVATFRNFE